MKFSLSILHLIIYISSILSHSQKLSRVAFNGILYQESHPSSKFLVYSKSIDADGLNNWSNLSAITTKYGLRSKALFCTSGSGGWFAYPDTNFEVGNVMSLQIISGETCIKADKILSIQPLGPIDKRIGTKLTPGLLTFQNIYYTSSYTLVDISSWTVSGRIKSLIHKGPHNWTIVGYVQTPSGKMKSIDSQLCLEGIPKGNSFCGIPDIDLLMGQVTDKIQVIKGCNVQNTTKVAVRNCYPEGSYKILVESEFPEPQTICKKYLETLQKRLILEYAMILEIWKMRMSSTSFRDTIIGDVDEPINHVPHSKLIRHAHEIFKDETTNLIPKFGFIVNTICPILPIDYTMVLTHLFEVIANHVFYSKNDQHEQRVFIDTIAAFHVALNNCSFSPSQNNETNQQIPISLKSLNDSKTCNNPDNTTQTIVGSGFVYSEIPFVKFFSMILHLLKTKCSVKPVGKEWNQEFHKFLSTSKFDWNTIYEIGLNGLNIIKIEQQILQCLGNVGSTN